MRGRCSCRPIDTRRPRAAQSELGKGSFQELDQLAAVRPFTKYAGRARALGDIAPTLAAAVRAAVGGRPGAAYVDLPSDVLMAAVAPGELPAAEALDLRPVGLAPVGARQHAAAEGVHGCCAARRGAQFRPRSALPRCCPFVNAGSGCCPPEQARRAGRPGPHRPPGICRTSKAQASHTGRADHARTPAMALAASGRRRKARASALRC